MPPHELAPDPEGELDADALDAATARDDAPKPSPQFRRRAWREFQRALDPLAPPKPLRPPGRR